MVWSRSSKKNAGTVLILVTIVAGYLFFFTSNLWMSAEGNAEKVTAMNTRSLYCDRKVTLIRWQYAEKQRKMEVELDIINEAFDGINAYEFSASTSDGTMLKVVPVVETEDFVVLALEELPKKWAEVSLHMELPEEAKTGSILKLYTNVKAVERVESLENLTEREYLLQRMDTVKQYYQAEIQRLEDEIEEKKREQEICREEILRLQKEEVYQTEEEKSSTEKLIANAELKIQNLEDGIGNQLLEIKEYEGKIENADKKKQMYEEMEVQE